MPAQSVVMTGNVAGVPELSFSGEGTARCVLTVACQDRYRDRSGEFKDGAAFFVRCVAWNALAEHIGQSVSKGDRIMVTGSFVSRTWDKDDGTKGYATDLRIDDAAVSLLWAEARVIRVRGSRRPASESVPSWVRGDDAPADTQADAAAAASISEGEPAPF